MLCKSNRRESFILRRCISADSSQEHRQSISSSPGLSRKSSEIKSKNRNIFRFSRHFIRSSQRSNGAKNAGDYTVTRSWSVRSPNSVITPPPAYQSPPTPRTPPILQATPHPSSPLVPESQSGNQSVTSRDSTESANGQQLVQIESQCKTDERPIQRSRSQTYESEANKPCPPDHVTVNITDDLVCICDIPEDMSSSASLDRKRKSSPQRDNSVQSRKSVDVKPNIRCSSPRRPVSEKLNAHSVSVIVHQPNSQEIS